jgi:hypothetical protein
LETGQNRQIGERDWLCANRCADRGRGFYQKLRDFVLGLPISRYPDHFHARLIRQLTRQNRHEPLGFRIGQLKCVIAVRRSQF